MHLSGNRRFQSHNWRAKYSPGTVAEEQADVHLRQASLGATIAGGAAMVAMRFLNNAAFDGLPDPHWHRSSFGEGRGTGRKGYAAEDSLTFLLYAVNMALAATGPKNRAAKQPYLPLLASLATAAQAVISARYLLRTLRKADERWCAYCVTDALTRFTTFAMTLPEAMHAAKRLSRRRQERSSWKRTER